MRGAHVLTSACRCTKHLQKAEKLLDCNLHILVSQAIDDRVEEGSKNCEHQGNDCVQHLWESSRETQVHKRYTAVEHHKDTKMRCTCRKGLLAPVNRGNPQDYSDDSGIREGNYQNRENDGNCVDHILNQNHGCVCTSQTQHRFKVTEDLMDLVGPTEGQCGNPCNLWEQHKKSKDAGTRRQLSTQLGGHNGWVAERITDGDIPVNGHGGQQNPL